MSANPIFVHSLFRSGSTYVFGAFRRSPAGYWCYQEPLNEHVRHVADSPERLLEIDARDGSLLRHPPLDKPYFWEFYKIRKAIAPLFRKEFSYYTFFIGTGHPSFGQLRSYLQALIDNAKGRPFFQCCRTTGRLAGLREAFGGTHILAQSPRSVVVVPGRRLFRRDDPTDLQCRRPAGSTGGHERRVRHFDVSRPGHR